MYCHIKRKKFEVHAFDIESHNDEESIAKRETSMWLGCALKEESQYGDSDIFFYSMEEVIDYFHSLVLNKKRNKKGTRPVINHVFFIWNLSFEWSFILPILLEKYNFKHNQFIDKADSEDNYFSSISTKSCSSVWEVKLKFKDSKGIIILRDLAKVFGGSLRAVAESLHLETQKGEIDYRLNRLHGHIITEEEKRYCYNDVRIIIEILLLIKEDKLMFQCLSAASYAMRTLINWTYPQRHKPYKAFRKDYPKLGAKESEFLRHNVAGGITYATPKYQFVDINAPILHIDMHSAHPTSAYLNYFPHGKGEYFEGEPKHPITKMACCHVLVSYSGVKLHSVIKLIGIDMIEDAELWLWDFEIETMKKCYINLEITYIDGYEYKEKRLKFRDFYNRIYNLRKEAKKAHDAYHTLYYKLLINSSYGKLLERPRSIYFENVIDEEGIIDSVIHDRDLSEKLEEDICNSKYTSLQVGSAIPAYTRCRLVESALKFGWEKIIYFDTDSIFVLYDEEVEHVWNTEFNHNDELGGWGIEDGGLISKAQFTAPKRYKYVDSSGEPIVKAGGINFTNFIKERADMLGIPVENYRLEYEEVNITSSKWKVQRAYRVKGGTIITFQEKEMKVDKKYMDIFNKNVKI